MHSQEGERMETRRSGWAKEVRLVALHNFALFQVFTELERKYGEIDEMNVCENIGEHMIGNVYVKFIREEDAEKAVKDLENRW